VIEEYEVGLGCPRRGADLVQLASTDKRCWVGARAMLHEDGGDLGFGGAG
jgi:hypothetical protein